MFKGTNKFWKGLALLLVLCMLPTVALAEEVATVAIKTAEAVDNTVTVTAEIGVKNTDITILAYRSATKVESGKPEIPAVETAGDVKGLKDTVVYIDQETAILDGTEAGSGAHTFTFIPRAVTGVGKYINVFVGGENVTATDFKQLTLANPSPVVAAPDALYKGCAVELTITKPSESWDADDTATWYADIAALKVGETTLTKDTDYSLNATKDAIVILNSAVSGMDSISAIEITGTEHADVTVPITTALTWGDKVAGTIKAVAVAPESKIDPVTVTLTLEDSTVDVCKGWIDEIDATEVKYSTDNGETYSAFAADAFAKSAGEITVTLPTVVEGTANYKLQIAVPDYTTVEIAEAIAVTSPTTAAWDAFEKPDVEYSKETAAEGEDFADYEGDDDDEMAAMYGQASVTLPASGANGTTYKWMLDSVDKAGTTVVLARPASEGDTPDTASYEFELTISKEGYTPVVKPVTFTVNKCGIAGVTVSVSPVFNAKAEANAVLAKDATITLSSADKEYPVVWNASEKVFKAEKVVAGAYTIKIERPGFFVATAEIEVTKQGTITGELPTLVAGNVNGDSTINILDVSAAIGHWDTNAIVADVNGDETVNILDVSTIIGNWDATGVGLGAN